MDQNCRKTFWTQINCFVMFVILYIREQNGLNNFVSGGMAFFSSKNCAINNLLGVQEGILEPALFFLNLQVVSFKLLLDVCHSCKKLKIVQNHFFYGTTALLFEKFGSVNFLGTEALIL